MTAPIDPNDPSTWPVADAVPADVFLGGFAHDSTPGLTGEQKTWPVAAAETDDVVLEPTLVVELTVRPGAASEEVALGMAEVLYSLSSCEESLGGSGLVYDGRKSRREEGRVRIVLYPRREAGAWKRLQEMAELIARRGSPILPETVLGERGSFLGFDVAAAA